MYAHELFVRICIMQLITAFLGGNDLVLEPYRWILIQIYEGFFADKFNCITRKGCLERISTTTIKKNEISECLVPMLPT